MSLMTESQANRHLAAQISGTLRDPLPPMHTERVAHRPARDAFDELEKEIHALHEALAVLTEKLDPVLTPPSANGEPGKPAGCPPQPCRSMVTQGLVMLIEKVRAARDHVNQVRDRVEV